MRLKKLMSLVLACAMALSLVTVASAADTEVYYVEDFSGYPDFATFAPKMYNTGVASGGSGEPGSAALAALNTYYNNQETKAPVIGYAYNVHGRDVLEATGAAVFETNDFGNKALTPYTREYSNNLLYTAVNKAYANLGQATILVQVKPWDYEEKTDETFIISYEIESNPTEIPKEETSMRWTSTLWQSDDGASIINKKNHDGKVTAPVTSDPAEGEEPESAFTGKNYDASEVEVIFEASSSKWTSSGYGLTMEHGKTYRIAHGNKYKEGQNWPTRIDALDGVAYGSGSLNNNTADTTFNSTGSHAGWTKLVGYSFSTTTRSAFGFANIRMYTIKNDSFKAVIENNTDVPLNTKTIRVKFANPVSLSRWTKEGAVVKAAGIPMAKGTYNIGDIETVVDGTEIYSYVDVTFTNLEEGTTYTIDFADTIANEIGTELGETNSVATFSTKLPDVKIMPLTVVGAESLVANGDLQTVKATLINNTSAPKNVALIYAVYAGTQLADVVYVNDTVAVDGAEYEVGLKLASAGTVKAFAWDGITSLKPYTGSVELDVE